MPTQYRCTDDRRRVEIRLTVGGDGKPLVNGIDYLEVSSDQRILQVHFLHPLPGQPQGVPASPGLAAANVLIEGGVRVTGIGVQSVSVSAEVLTVNVDRVGDFSTYRLSIVTSPADPHPPQGFDPQVSLVLFSFKVDCPSDFDCPAGEPCVEPVPPAPQIDYLAKDYASFRRLMLDRLAVIMPQWQERNPADQGIALVELLAYAADQLSYYQDAVATEAYLGTARRRTSVRRHARLVDYFLDDGANARAWVCFEVADDLRGSGENAVLPTSTALLTRAEDPTPVVKPVDLNRALAEAPTVFQTLYPVTLLKKSRNAIPFYTWGDRRCCLPRGATCATLQGSAADLELARGDVLIFEEILGPETGLKVDANPSRRHAVRLSRAPIERQDPLNGTTVLDICWYDADALPCPLCLWEVADETGQSRGVSVARGNVVLADHGHTVEEPLHPPQVPEHGRYRPALPRTGLTHWVPFDQQVERGRPAAAVLQSDVRRVMPAITLRGDGEDWRPQWDLLASDRFLPEFVVEMEDDGAAAIRFGDGVLGQRPSSGSRFTARYRVGNGLAGNVGAEALGRVVTTEIAITAVRNPLPATGGREPELTEKVRLYAPQAFRRQERAISEADYVAMAQRHPDVNRAAATVRWTGSWYTVFITVDRKSGTPVDAAFRSELEGFLERFRFAGYDLEIDSPRFVPLDIVLTVCVEPGYLRAHVKAALLETFSTADLLAGGRGFFHPGNFSFGDPVYLSQVVTAAMRVPGVRWVDTDDSPGKPNRFRRWGQDSHGESAAGLIKFNRLEIALLENDPNAPQSGRIDFVMLGGL